MAYNPGNVLWIETGFLYAALAVLEVAIEHRLPLNSALLVLALKVCGAIINIGWCVHLFALSEYVSFIFMKVYFFFLLDI